MDLLATAKALAERVEAEAARAKVPVAVSVMDVHGNLVLQHRMNDAPLFAVEISARKAYTSALIKVRTADLLPLVQPGEDLFPLLTLAGGRFTAMGGGVPITENGRVVAGLGVSGGATTQEDMAIVNAAVN
jgi:uncharacterized protein GlcG (DUF336 family)